MNIHELREEATCYYDNAPRQIQTLVHQFFDAMDTNGDGGVDFYEIHNFLQGRSFLTRFLNRSVFNELDEDGDRSLDFYEFITFFYMIFMLFDCDECGHPLVGQRHYTCEICFTSPHPNSTPYNVCGSCYINRGSFRHQNHPPRLVDYRAMILEGAGRSSGPPTPRGGYRGGGGGFRGGGGGGYRGGGYRGGGGGGGYRGGGYRNVPWPPERSVTRRRETFGEIIEFLDGAHTVYELAGAAAACNVM